MQTFILKLDAVRDKNYRPEPWFQQIKKTLDACVHKGLMMDAPAKNHEKWMVSFRHFPGQFEGENRS